MYDFKIFYPEVYNVYIGFHTILEYCNIRIFRNHPYLFRAV